MDYQLYPIRKTDIDKEVYFMVKAVMVMRSVRNFQNYEKEFPEEDHLNIRELALKYENQEIFLVFPAHHPQFRLYPPEISRQRAIIVIYERPDPEEYGYNTTHTFIGYLDTNLTFHPYRHGQVQVPSFTDTSRQLYEAITPILRHMESRLDTRNEWYQRLKDTQAMIAERAEGMHILHNAGLFDYENLWRQLTITSGYNKDIDAMKEQMEEALEGFAMSVVNGTWKTTAVAQPAGLFTITTLKEKVTPAPKPAPTSTTPKPPTPQASTPESKKPTIDDIYDQYAPKPHIRKTVDWVKYREQDKKREQEKREHNRKIVVRGVVLTLAIIIIFLLFALTQYALVGTVTTLGVVGTWALTAKVRMMSQHYKFTHPQSFRTVLAFVRGLVPFILILPCSALGKGLYHITNGVIGPGSLFLIVLSLMAPLFVWAYKQRMKQTEDMPSRPYTFLMSLTIVIVIGQGIGSIVASSDVEYEKWKAGNDLVEWEEPIEGGEEDTGVVDLLDSLTRAKVDSFAETIRN